MGLEKVGTIGNVIIAWTKTIGKNMPMSKSIEEINTCGLKYLPKLKGDVTQFTTKEIKLNEELLNFLPWRSRGYDQLPPTGKPPLYTEEAKKATESFIEKCWIEEPLPNGFRIAFGPYKAFDKDGAIKASMKAGSKSGQEYLYFNEESKGIKKMVDTLEKIYSDNPNITEEQKAKILHKFVDACYDRNRAKLINEFSSDFIPIENTAASGAGVCRHKSFLAKVLGDKLGLNVAMARGHYVTDPELGIGESHIWNEVRIGDKWYLMDIERNRFKDLDKFSEFSDLYEYR